MEKSRVKISEDLMDELNEVLLEYVLYTRWDEVLLISEIGKEDGCLILNIKWKNKGDSESRHYFHSIAYPIFYESDMRKLIQKYNEKLRREIDKNE